MTLRTIPSAMATHLAGSITTLALCWRIERVDGTIEGYTAHDRSIVYDGETYSHKASFAPVATDADLSLRADTSQLRGLLTDSGINLADIYAGRYDGAEVEFFVVDYEDPDGTGRILLPGSGRFGDVSIAEGTYEVDVVSYNALLQQRIGSRFVPFCRWQLGDSDCEIDLETGSSPDATAYKHVTTVSAVTSRRKFTTSVTVSAESGTTSLVNVTSTAIEAEDHATPNPTQSSLASATVDFADEGISAGMEINVSGFTEAANNGIWEVVSVRSPDADGVYRIYVEDPDGTDRMTHEDAGDSVTITDETLQDYSPSPWFRHGKVKATGGNNSGIWRGIKNYDADTGEVTLYLPFPYDLAVSDGVILYAGCDLRRQTCLVKFANVLNFGGEPDLPGDDQINDYPDHKPVKVD